VLNTSSSFAGSSSSHGVGLSTRHVTLSVPRLTKYILEAGSPCRITISPGMPIACSKHRMIAMTVVASQAFTSDDISMSLRFSERSNCKASDGGSWGFVSTNKNTELDSSES
jgi:hypothetical protein